MNAKVDLYSAGSKISIFIGLIFSSITAAEQVTVAVAANFINPMQQLVIEFEKYSNHTVTLVSGSSGRFFAQISHGAPYDLLLSADSEKPKKLIDSDLALASSLFTYA
ncbi:MAG: molybdate transport system substrate-binding protein, partial [Moritella dasanensis]